MNKISPDPDKFAKLIKEHSGPIVMLNLLKFKAKAQGGDRCGGIRSIRLKGRENDRGRRRKGLVVRAAGVGADRRFVRRVGRRRTCPVSKSEGPIRNGIDAGLSANP
jgi:hypothetical protein